MNDTRCESARATGSGTVTNIRVIFKDLQIFGDDDNDDDDYYFDRHLEKGALTI